jgi:hypothetical protein
VRSSASADSSAARSRSSIGSPPRLTLIETIVS